MDFAAVLSKNIFAQVGVAVLYTVPYGVDAVGPEAVDELVFPFVVALGNRFVVFVDKYCLYSGRAELNAEDGFALYDGIFCGHTNNVCI